MAFEFKRNQSVTKGLRRLARAQVEEALQALRNHDRLQAVHDVRKTIKKLRSLLRLVRSGLGGSAYRGANAPLRECARLLSRPRDFHVKFDAFTELVHNFDAELASRPFPKTRQVLADDCRRAEREFQRQKTALRARTLLQRFARQAESLKLKPSGWRALAPGIKRTYRAARRAHRLVLREGTAENFHEWRKQTKTLLYQVQLLCPIWPEQMCAAKAELKHLGQLLGDDMTWCCSASPNWLNASAPRTKRRPPP